MATPPTRAYPFEPAWCPAPTLPHVHAHIRPHQSGPQLPPLHQIIPDWQTCRPSMPQLPSPTLSSSSFGDVYPRTSFMAASRSSTPSLLGYGSSGPPTIDGGARQIQRPTATGLMRRASSNEHSYRPYAQAPRRDSVVQPAPGTANRDHARQQKEQRNQHKEGLCTQEYALMQLYGFRSDQMQSGRGQKPIGPGQSRKENNASKSGLVHTKLPLCDGNIGVLVGNYHILRACGFSDETIACIGRNSHLFRPKKNYCASTEDGVDLSERIELEDSTGARAFIAEMMAERKMKG